MQALPQEKVRHCSFTSCVEDALTMCHKCSRWFCLEHASDLEPTKYCLECLKVEDASLEVSPIIGIDGTRHSGRVIRPVGIVFSQNSKLIHEMTDDELKEYIVRYQQAVHDCERSLEYARITLGNAHFEAGHREISKVNARGEVYFPSPKKVPAPVKQRKVKATDEDKILEYMMKHLNPTQLLQYLTKIKKGV